MRGLLEVQGFIDLRHENGRYELCTRWKGFAQKDDTWEPQEVIWEDVKKLMGRIGFGMTETMIINPPWHIASANPTRGVKLKHKTLPDEEIKKIPTMPHRMGKVFGEEASSAWTKKLDGQSDGRVYSLLEGKVVDDDDASIFRERCDLDTQKTGQYQVSRVEV
eukprot:augustus_masked-scaffold_17-processed-gene-0.4-mRNA-1 protein AED:1.00 eAED:1.00 QI:0/0/0/0/1/1/3/0/162